MPGYHLYFFDLDGHIKAAAELECDSDDAAKLSAEDLRDGRPMELWFGARIVETYPAPS